MLENLQNIIDDQTEDLKDLGDTLEDQNDTIEDLKSKVGELTEKLTEISEAEQSNKEQIVILERSVDTLNKETDTSFDRLSEKDSKIGQELLQQKVKDLECNLTWREKVL